MGTTPLDDVLIGLEDAKGTAELLKVEILAHDGVVLKADRVEAAEVMALPLTAGSLQDLVIVLTKSAVDTRQ
jgi:hypothetical protein